MNGTKARRLVATAGQHSYTAAMKRTLFMTALAACGSDSSTAPLPTGAIILDGETAGQAGDYASIAVADDGEVHVAYVADNALKYTHGQGGTFAASIVIDDSVVVQDTAIAALGNTVYITYHDATNVDLREVAITNGVAGASAIIDGDGHQSGTGLRQAVDALGTRHVLYFDYEAVAFKYATSTVGMISGEPTAMIPGGSSPDLVADANGTAHVVFIDPDVGGAYATNNGGGPFAEGTLVDSAADTAAIGGSDLLRIAHASNVDTSLSVSEADGANWLAAAAPGGDSFAEMQITTAPNDNAYLVYVDVVADRHRIMRMPVTSEYTASVIDDVSAGPGLAAAADSSAVHIVYQASLGAGRSQLRYKSLPL